MGSINHANQTGNGNAGTYIPKAVVSPSGAFASLGGRKVTVCQSSRVGNFFKNLFSSIFSGIGAFFSRIYHCFDKQEKI